MLLYLGFGILLLLVILIPLYYYAQRQRKESEANKAWNLEVERRRLESLERRHGKIKDPLDFTEYSVGSIVKKEKK